MKKNIGDLKSRKEELTEQTTGLQKDKAKTSAQSGKAKTGSQSAKEKTGSQAGTTKTGSQTDKPKTGKERKRMVIQEVDSEEESKPIGNSLKSIQ